MSGRPEDPIGELLAQSLVVWRIAGSIERAGDSALRIHGGTKEIAVERAPSDLPFRWIVEVEGRRRGALSIIAVLRQIRAALDPDYAAKRVRISVAPPVSP